MGGRFPEARALGGSSFHTVYCRKLPEHPLQAEGESDRKEQKGEGKKIHLQARISASFLVGEPEDRGPGNLGAGIPRALLRFPSPNIPLGNQSPWRDCFSQAPSRIGQARDERAKFPKGGSLSPTARDQASIPN